MQIIQKPVNLELLWQQRQVEFKDMIKAVVDVEQGILAVDAELHSDLENLLLEMGSQQRALWGINIYPHLQPDQMIEFTSFINIRPSQDNCSMEVQDEGLRQRIHQICATLLVRDAK